MLFSSFQFIFIFLPICLGVFFSLEAFGWRTAAVVWLVIASLAFYGEEQPSRLPLIIVSIVLNYTIGYALMTHKNIFFLVAGISLNLFVLGYFKYADFLSGAILPVFGATYASKNITMPIGISFFTFTQIASLVDAWSNKVRDHNPLRYALFVTYFPHLVAGLILHHKDIMPLNL